MIKTFEAYNNHYKTLRRNQIFDKIENAKIGDILPESDIYNYIEYLHEQDDFTEGDIAKRIEEFSKYQLRIVPIDKIDIYEFGLDEDVAKNYSEMYNQTNKYPPIVLSDTYRIIDGNHRTNALNDLGIKTIKAFVGMNF